jgi:hypothetical protein
MAAATATAAAGSGSKATAAAATGNSTTTSSGSSSGSNSVKRSMMAAVADPESGVEAKEVFYLEAGVVSHFCKLIRLITLMTPLLLCVANLKTSSAKTDTAYSIFFQ